MLWIGGIEDIAATDEHVDTGSYETGSCLTLYTTVDLDERRQTLPGNHPTQAFNLFNGILDELEKLHINEGDTVRMYGYSFEYYRNADTVPANDTDEYDDEEDET